MAARNEETRHVITMLVENVPGVTARVVGLFAGRGYNIETICGAPTHNPELSRITITTWATDAQLEMIMKQLHRLINVIKLADMTSEAAVRREIALIYVKAVQANRVEISQAVGAYHGKIIHYGSSHFIVEVIGREEKVNAMIRFLKPFGIKKVARSGELALYRDTE